MAVDLTPEFLDILHTSSSETKTAKKIDKDEKIDEPFIDVEKEELARLFLAEAKSMVIIKAESPMPFYKH